MWSPEITIVLTLLLLHNPHRAHGDDLEPTFHQCCTLGTNWAREELKCSSFPAPVPGIQTEQQSICLSAVDICCVRAQGNRICEAGKDAAKAGLECKSAPGFGGEYQKYCCEACKLGLISGSMAMDCKFKAFSFGPPWDLPYASCCFETSPTTATPTKAAVTTPPSSTPATSNPKASPRPLS